jgi:regulatory protein
MLSEDGILRLGHAVGDDADPAELSALASECQTPAARMDALRHLSRAEHTMGQLSRYLAGRGYSAAVIEAVVKWAGERGIVDDRRFASVFLDSHTTHSPLGARRIRQELRKRGVPEAAVSEALEERDDASLFDSLVETVRRKYGRLPKDAAFRRAAGYLTRRGFSTDLVFRILAKALDGSGGEPD